MALCNTGYEDFQYATNLTFDRNSFNNCNGDALSLSEINITFILNYEQSANNFTYNFRIHNPNNPTDLQFKIFGTITIFEGEGTNLLITGFENNNTTTIGIAFDPKGFYVTGYPIIYFFDRYPNDPSTDYSLKVYNYIGGKVIITNGTFIRIGTSNQNIPDLPQILINSQYLIDQSDIGNTLFEVRDINDKISSYEKACPKIVSVLKGVGLTARDKVNYIFTTERYKINVLGLQFFDNLVKYSVVKYFLSYLLYGKWNIKYLLGKYNNKFLDDLKNSQYNKFYDGFTNPNSEVYGYNEFFLRNFK